MASALNGASVHAPMEPRAEFPLWIEYSGLPTLLNDSARTPSAWLIFRKIVELDIEANATAPGTIEITPAALGLRCGVPARALRRVLGAFRKARVLRAFLPQEDDEPALFQITVPLPTPTPPAVVAETHPGLFGNQSLSALRYATEPDGDLPSTAEKRRRVIDLYLDVVSMRMNAFIQDELRLIAERYDQALVEKVFARARQRDTPSLGWILAEIRREIKVEAQARAASGLPPTQ